MNYLELPPLLVHLHYLQINFSLKFSFAIIYTKIQFTLKILQTSDIYSDKIYVQFLVNLIIMHPITITT